MALGHAMGLRELGHDVTVATTDLVGLSPIRRWTANSSNGSSRDANTAELRVLRFHGSVGMPATIRSKHVANPMPFVYSVSLFRWLKRHVSDYDVTHVHFAREIIPTFAALIALHRGVPFVLQPHGMLNNTHGVRRYLDRLIVARVLRSASGVLALNALEAATVRNIAPDQQVHIIGNPVIPHVGSRPPDHPGEDIVLFLSRLHPRKRVEAFIRMARELNNGSRALRFVVAGPDGGSLASARALSKQLSLSNLEFLGALEPDRAREEIARASVYVLPSTDEPYPMTVLEAMAAGTPAVLTTGCHIHGELSQAGAAIVTKPDPSSLARGVEQALEPNLRSVLIVRGRQWVLQNASTTAIAQQLIDVYRSSSNPSCD